MTTVSDTDDDEQEQEMSLKKEDTALFQVLCGNDGLTSFSTTVLYKNSAVETFYETCIQYLHLI
jgi:hypothetical protein